MVHHTWESTASGTDSWLFEKSELPEGRATPLDPSPSFLPPISELRWRSNKTSNDFVLNTVGSSPTALVDSRLSPTCETRFKAFCALCLLCWKGNRQKWNNTPAALSLCISENSHINNHFSLAKSRLALLSGFSLWKLQKSCYIGKLFTSQQTFLTPEKKVHIIVCRTVKNTV